jgi:pyruvate kinase
MVSMPSEAAIDAQLVQNLVEARMDVMRINCAHDGLAEWVAMVDNLRRAEQTLGWSCRVAMDLAGPKLRTGALRASGRVQRLARQRDCFGRLARPGRVWLTLAEAAEPTPLVIVPATGGRGFSRSGAQAPLMFFEISGIAAG